LRPGRVSAFDFPDVSISHEKLDVYRLALSYVSWVARLCSGIKGNHGNARDQIIRASQSIPLNIAEGNGKTALADRRRYFEIARGSALECAAIQDILEILGVLSPEENIMRKEDINRIAIMLSKLGGRGFD
jgi:four helix bundle protein